MSVASKIVAITVVSTAGFMFYWFVHRNRRPKIVIENIDWLAKTATVKFGNNTALYSSSKLGVFAPGRTYDPEKYTMTVSFKEEKLTLTERNEENLITQQITIDFRGKLIF